MTMERIERYEINVTTDASGDATGLSNKPVTGRVLQMRYIPDGSDPLDAGADIVVSGQITGQPILTQANIGSNAFSKAPRQPIHGSDDGAASVYAAAGEPVEDFIYLAKEKIRLVVAQGTSAKTGKFIFWVG